MGHGPDDGNEPNNGYLHDHLMEFEELGLRCHHVRAALEVGCERIRKLTLYGTAQMVRDEFAQTDPLVRLYYLIAAQRALFRATQGLATIDRVLDIVGRDTSTTTEALEKLLSGCWNILTDLFNAEARGVGVRLEHLHDEEAPEGYVLWEYPPLPTRKDGEAAVARERAGLPANNPRAVSPERGETVTIDDETAAWNLLQSLESFGFSAEEVEASESEEASDGSAQG